MIGGIDSTKGRKPILWLASSLPSRSADIEISITATVMMLKICAAKRADDAEMTRLAFMPALSGATLRLSI